MIFCSIENGERRYTLNPEGSQSASPAKYSVEDKFSSERIVMKKRYGIFPFCD